MAIPFHSEQVDFLFRIAEHRNEWFDLFFRALNYFDSPYFLMVLIPFIWVGVSCKWGIRIAFLLIINGLVNFHLKRLLDMPRPIVDYPELAMFPFNSPGMPSGAAQMAILLGGLLVATWKSGWSWVVAFLFVLVISFSRLYLGVHYPIDILGGWAVGLILLYGFLKGLPFIERLLAKQGRAFGLLICAVICFLYTFFLPIPPIYKLMGAWLGFGVGAYLSMHWELYTPASKNIQWRIYKGVAAVLSLFAIYALIHHQFIPFIESFILSFWISFGAVPFCRFVFPKK